MLKETLTDNLHLIIPNIEHLIRFTYFAPFLSQNFYEITWRKGLFNQDFQIFGVVLRTTQVLIGL